MGIKKQSKSNKISREQKQTFREKVCEQYPAISYRYITRNDRYVIKDSREQEVIAHKLHKKFLEITQEPWAHWLQLGKKNGGFETMEFSRIKMKPNGYNLTGDEKIIIFRFNSSNCRILGFRKDNCPTLFVIGFDLGFSAYDHGS